MPAGLATTLQLFEGTSRCLGWIVNGKDAIAGSPTPYFGLGRSV